MSSRRVCPISAVVNGKLYVMGGTEDLEDGTEAMNSGEVYDPELDSWSPICPMKYKRTGGDTVVYNGKIYVFGGATETRLIGIHNKVERYDPVNDTWTCLKSMKTKREFHSAYLSCGKIFVFGGYIEWNVHTKSVEMYDPLTDTWEHREPMASKASFCLPLSVPAHLPSPVSNLESILINSFRVFHIKEELFRSLTDNGFEQAYTAQSECLRQATIGNDFLCHAHVGAGKTALLVIATLQQLKIVDGDLSTLVLCFSRDHVNKIREEYERLSKYLSIKTTISLRGVSADKDKVVFEKERPHILIGTPLRIKNLIQAGALKVGRIKCLAIYDGDRILQDRDTRNSIWKILNSISTAKQIMLFSQSQTEQLRNFCKNHMRKTPHFYEFREE